ncbi:cupin domain-containing protein [Methylopila sp. 73B]|uniref:cupin domain-containing protein n=1 Tax=Methylopila sp. 73B TaxID=1120792 RepID=UPI000362F7BD|nr:cupin domain-containing protein [Methylopila sp. 73B]
MANRYEVGEKDTRPWGTWEVIAGGENYAVKRIVVSPGARLSLQKHQHREEHWIVVEGEGIVTRDDERIPVKTGVAVHLPLHCVHRVENPGKVDLVFIEVQRGDPLDEDDIERIEDDYGRAPAGEGSTAPAGAPSGFAGVTALVMDFDGVFTDDRVLVDQDGREAVFASRSDGMGLERLRKLTSIRTLILSKEPNPVVSARGAKLKIEVLQGIDDKLPELDRWLAANGLTREQTVYIGNDVNDLECLRAVGFPVAPADARAEAKAAARFVTTALGGRGALRELCERLIADHVPGVSDQASARYAAAS